PFDARIRTYAADWPAAGARALASTPPSPAPSAAAKAPNNLYFPSAKSIPPVNIMTAEPPPAQRPPQDTTGAVEAATPTPPRRPPQTNSQTRPPSSAAPARAAPLPPAPAQSLRPSSEDKRRARMATQARRAMISSQLVRQHPP